MIDEHSIEIVNNAYGQSIVQGREFCGNHWHIRVSVGNFKIRVWHPLENPPKVGDRCDLKFIEGHNGILFPGAISCKI